MTTSEIVRDLGPVLIWLHSKKHDAKSSADPWKLAWNAMAEALYPYLDRKLHYLEQAAHEAQGLPPVDECGCVHCSTDMRYRIS